MTALDRITDAFGPPQVYRQIRSETGVIAVVSRLLHNGGTVDLRGSDSFRLVFNISGGQVVEQQSGDGVRRRTIEAGSLASVGPDDPQAIRIVGRADTLQIVVAKGFIDGCCGTAGPRLVKSGPVLRAAAVQALVALSRKEASDEAELRAIVVRIAREFAQPPLAPGADAYGGLSPEARRRVAARMDAALKGPSGRLVSLGELAGAAGLSVHHFIKAFRRSEGVTPHARVLARRVDRALLFLLEADARVDDVAAAAGFSSPSHFISTFRRFMGVTPGAFRAAARSSTVRGRS